MQVGNTCQYTENDGGKWYAAIVTEVNGDGSLDLVVWTGQSSPFKKDGVTSSGARRYQAIP